MTSNDICSYVKQIHLFVKINYMYDCWKLYVVLLTKTLGKQVNRIFLSQNLLFKSVFGLCCGDSMYSES